MLPKTPQRHAIHTGRRGTKNRLAQKMQMKEKLSSEARAMARRRGHLLSFEEHRGTELRAGEMDGIAEGSSEERRCNDAKHGRNHADETGKVRRRYEIAVANARRCDKHEPYLPCRAKGLVKCDKDVMDMGDKGGLGLSVRARR